VLRKLVILFFVGLGLFGLLAATTLVALEGEEVIVLRTFDSAANVQEARVWVADVEGQTWIEVADARKEFYRRMLANPEVEVVRGEETVRYRAVPDLSRAAHDRIRALLANKYGLADRWVGLLVDTSGSIAVRLVPLDQFHGSDARVAQ
jgi:hypothetical protein